MGPVGKGLEEGLDRGPVVAWVSYVPIPGLAIVVARMRPASRLVRFHAWQGGFLTVLLWIFMLFIGFVAQMTGAFQAMGAVAGVVGVLGILGILVGAAGAARGRFNRVRPIWDLALMVRRDRV